MSPTHQRQRRLLTGEMRVRLLKYTAQRGVVKTMAPRETETLPLRNRPAAPRSRPLPSQSLSLGVTQRMPPMAAKESCRLTEAAAKGFASRMRSRAAKMAVRLSRSRPKRGAKSRNESITQARSTEGEAPESRA